MNSEHNTCAFCRKETSVARQYLHAKNKPSTGDGFHYIYYCGECGLKETVLDNNNTPTPKEWEEERLERLLNNYAGEFISEEAFNAHKAFVKRLLSQQKQELVEEIRKLIKKENSLKTTIAQDANLKQFISKTISQEKEKWKQIIETKREECKKYPLKSMNGSITDKTANDMVDVALLDIIKLLQK